MIGTEIVKLSGGKEAKVSEISARQLFKILPFLSGDEKEKEKDVKTGFVDKAQEFMQISCGLGADDVLDLRSSDYEKLWEAFKNVNSFFFKVAENLGLGEQLKKTIVSVMSGVGDELVTSLKQDIEVALTTDSAGLSKQPDDGSETGEDES